MKAKIDLCKVFGVEEGQEFKIENDEDVFRIKNNTLQYYSNYKTDFVDYLSLINTLQNKEITIIKKYKLTQNAYNFLNVIRECFLARDDNGVFVFTKKPIRENFMWIVYSRNCCNIIDEKVFNIDLSFIKWEDEPVQVKDILKNCEIIED